MDFELAGTVILSGLVIVFLVLILLTAIVSVFGKIMTKNSGAKKNNDIAQPAPAVAAAAPAAPVMEDGISDEIIAVISASIAAVLGDGFVVKNVKRAAAAKAGRNAWSMAGMQQNMLPF